VYLDRCTQCGELALFQTLSESLPSMVLDGVEVRYPLYVCDACGGGYADFAAAELATARLTDFETAVFLRCSDVN
jgi:hypothetical protein